MGVGFSLADDLRQNSGLLREWEAVGMDSREVKQELRNPKLDTT